MESVTPIDEEFIFDNSVIMSETDLKGIILYVNRKFCEVSGYDRKELKGQNHNIVKSDLTPNVVYQKLWNTIEKGQDWMGVFKNIRKDGRYYWIHTFISPISKDNSIVGYAAASRAATKLEVEETVENYAKLQ